MMKRHNNISHEPYKGRVCGVLSGDSVIIHFSTPGIPEYQVVSLEHLIAPKFGSSDGQIPDQPWGYNSWEFIRQLTIGQRVLVLPPPNRTEQQRIHPAFGKLPVFYSRILLADKGNEDVGLICVRAGWVKIRSPKIRDNYVNNLFSGAADAERSQIGIWRSKGFIRKLPVNYIPDNLLQVAEFDAIFEGVHYATSFSLFLLPNFEHISFQPVGVRGPSPKSSESEFVYPAKSFSIQRFLHQKTRVRLLNVSESNVFSGVILDRADRHIRCLILSGLARFYPHTADLCPSASEYLRCEDEARAQRQGIWSTYDVPNDQVQSQIEGTVISIVGTCAFKLLNSDYIIQLSSLGTAPYIYGGTSEPMGWETREFLRRWLIGKNILCIVDGHIGSRLFCTVYAGGACVNEVLCRNGLAKVCHPIIGNESERAPDMKEAEAEAAARKIGLHQTRLPDVFSITDSSWKTNPNDTRKQLKELRSKILTGIIETVSGGSRFCVLVPSLKIMVRLGVHGLLPLSPNDKIGQEAINFCEQHYLQRDVKFEILEADRSGGFLANIGLISADQFDVNDQGKFEDGIIENIAISLLFEGLAEVHPHTAKTLSYYDFLVQAQQQAIENQKGKWADSVRIPISLEPHSLCSVQAIALWEVSSLLVQFLSPEMAQITKTLNTDLDLVDHISNGEIVAVDIFGRYYRGIVENEDYNAVKVKLIDEGFSTVVEPDHVCVLPSELKNIPQQGLAVKLAFVKTIAKKEEEAAAVWDLVRGKELFMEMVDGKPKEKSVIIWDNAEKTGGTLNGYVLQKFSTQFEPGSTTDFSDIQKILQECAAKHIQ